MSRVLNAVFCDSILIDNQAKSFSCIGIFRKLQATSYPAQFSFSLIAWMEEAKREDEFTIVISDKNGQVRGVKKNRKPVLSGEDGSGELTFHFKDFVFNSPDDSYFVEIQHVGRSLLRKEVSTMRVPKVVPMTTLGDVGYLELE